MKDSIFLRVPKNKELIIEKYKEALHIRLRNKKKKLLGEKCDTIRKR